MKTYRTAAALRLIALGAGLIAVSSCGKKAVISPLPNRPPTVRLTSAPLSPVTRNDYLIMLNWIGFDPDGRVDHYLFAIDPPVAPGSDTLWEATTLTQLTRSFESNDTLETPNFSEYHVFVIKAVDNRGALSPPESRAFTSFTVAPSVLITAPQPTHLLEALVTPAVLIRWEGDDLDGKFTKKPVKYRYKLLSDQTELKPSFASQNQDSVRRFYAARNWAGWDSTTADVTTAQFTNLSPDQYYMFCVISIDEAGAYSPFFNRNTNMLYFKVTFAGSNNPRIGLFNEFFAYEYAQGVYDPTNPAVEIPLEVPAGEFTINWYAHPKNEGGPIKSYRWAVDILDLSDNTRRSDEETDLAHWSQRSEAVTSARLSYPGGQTHKFYLEAEDINNLKSLGVIRFTVVQATFEKLLGIVDDTRLSLGRVAGGTSCDAPVNRPISRWPSAAELDTFLYARGGVPWRCYPAGTMSTPGIFAGYDFDTLNSRQGLKDMSMRLSRLGRYLHLIWLTDGLGAYNGEEGTNLAFATTSMRYMNDFGKANNVAAYIRQGGKVWLVGATATASLVNFDRPVNNVQQPMPFPTWSFANSELVSGRFIYDQAHWRSEMKQLRATLRIRRHLGRFESNPAIYQFLPLEMQAKTTATDPFPPNRQVNFGDFYQTQFDIEFLSAPNPILEDQDPAAPEDFQSTLDTLYRATGAALPADQINPPRPQVWPVMTYYRGTTAGYTPAIPDAGFRGVENPPLILTGFNIWNFRRSQCKALVDFVLQRMWGIQPTQPVASPARGVRAVQHAPFRPRLSSLPPAGGRAAQAQRAAGGTRD